MDFSYLPGTIVSFVLGYIYVYWIRKDFTSDEAIANIIVVTIFSWLGVAFTVMGTITVIVNKFSKKD